MRAKLQGESIEYITRERVQAILDKIDEKIQNSFNSVIQSIKAEEAINCLLERDGVIIGGPIIRIPHKTWAIKILPKDILDLEDILDHWSDDVINELRKDDNNILTVRQTLEMVVQDSSLVKFDTGDYYTEPQGSSYYCVRARYGSGKLVCPH